MLGVTTPVGYNELYMLIEGVLGRRDKKFEDGTWVFGTVETER
jgi:hypothetical protein